MKDNADKVLFIFLTLFVFGLILRLQFLRTAEYEVEPYDQRDIILKQLDKIEEKLGIETHEL